MNILFVYSLDDVVSFKKPLAMQEQMQFGIAYISSFLKASGHTTQLVVLSRIFKEKNKKHLIDAIETYNPGVICFSSVATEFGFMTEIAAFVRSRWPSVKMLIGGVHVTLNPQDALGHNFDAICIGEGEEPVREYVDAVAAGKTPSNIQNLWIKTARGVERNQTRAFIKDLNGLPFPDRDIWQEWIADVSQERFAVLLGRGCPFLCTYCSNHALRKVAPGPYVRFRSIENVMKEIEELATRYAALKEIYFEVETIGTNQIWAIELCDALVAFNATRETSLSFGANLRITTNQTLDDLFAAFHRANFRFLNIGVESGSDRVRRDILKRQYSNHDIIWAVETARKYGIKVCFFNLMGIPGETEEDFKQTIEINRVCQPDWYFLSIFYPYPGTELFDRCHAMGLVPQAAPAGMERRDTVLALSTFPRARMLHYYFWFEYYVRKGYRSRAMIYLRVLSVYLLSRRVTTVFYRAIVNSRLLKSFMVFLKGY